MNLTRPLLPALLMIGFTATGLAQTEGTATFQGTLLDYNGSSTKHWTVGWVTREDGTFIKSLRKQGPSWTATHWDSHCRVWNTARGGSASGSQALDGYSSATAADYSGTNNPVIWSWNCQDTAGNVVPDGNYKFWLQYAEDSGQGPHTTNGMVWAKGPAGATNSYANIAGRFTNLKVTWLPSAPPAIAPTITSAAPTGTGTVGVPYAFTCTATGTTPITFTATGLPPGLAMETTGLIGGTPIAAGTFAGEIKAANGTLPDATQGFSILIAVEPVNVGSVLLDGNNLVLQGTGPADGTYSVLLSPDPGRPAAEWTVEATGTIDAAGRFTYTNAVEAGPGQWFYRLRLP
jgi:hypothetical protein